MSDDEELFKALSNFFHEVVATLGVGYSFYKASYSYSNLNSNAVNNYENNRNYNYCISFSFLRRS